MEIATQQYIRKPLYVDAVRITAANMDAMAAWCQGEIQQDEVPGEGTGKKFIKVRVHNPKNPRQTKGYVGDWILYTPRGYKIYTNKAFHALFDVVLHSVEETTVSPDQMTTEVLTNGASSNGEEKLDPEAIVGKRVLSREEQDDLTPNAVRELVQSGEAVLAQDIS